MPAWVDLSDHDAVLNVHQTALGKQLILRTLSQTPLPSSVISLGFHQNGDYYQRDNLRFTLQEIQQHFPLARSREFELTEILWQPPAAAMPVALEPAPPPDISQQDEPDPSAVEEILFTSKRRAGTRPAAHAAIRLMRVGDHWYSAISIEHNLGNMAGRSGPLSTYSHPFSTRAGAVFSAGQQVIRHANEIATRYDSMVTDKQRAVAREMGEWAHQEIMPVHTVAPVSTGLYLGMYQARVVEGEFAGSVGLGDTEANALARLRERLLDRYAEDNLEWRHVGENNRGQRVVENAVGVRAYELNGALHAETVRLSDSVPLLNLDKRGIEYVTREELASLRAPAKIETTAPAAASAKGMADAIAVQVGEVVAGAEVHLVVDDVPVSLFRRKLGKYEPRSERRKDVCTYARALIDGQWRSLGEPWEQARPSNAELRAAIQYARANPDKFDGDAMLQALANEVEEENKGLIDQKFRREPPSPDLFAIQRVDEKSYEIRFRDPALPFAVLLEFHSPGVYVPTLYRGGSGSQISLANAACWAVTQLNVMKRHYQQVRTQICPHHLTIECTKSSFDLFIGVRRDDLATAAHLVKLFPQADGKEEKIAYRHGDDLCLPADFAVTWTGDASVLVTFGEGPAAGVELVAIDGRAVDVKFALGTAMSHIKGERLWASIKAERSDGGAQLESLAAGYANFLQERFPTLHSNRPSANHRNFALAIEEKKIDFLISVLARPVGQNDISKQFFSKVTGVVFPKTATGCKAALYAWAGYSPADAQQREASLQAERKERFVKEDARRALDYATSILENSRVSLAGQEMSAKTFLEKIIGEGFDTLETARRGAVDRYRLVNRTEGRMYPIKGSMVDYARHVLAVRASLTPKLGHEAEDALKPSLKPA